VNHAAGSLVEAGTLREEAAEEADGGGGGAGSKPCCNVDSNIG
jgi:hypothetical protein